MDLDTIFDEVVDRKHKDEVERLKAENRQLKDNAARLTILGWIKKLEQAYIATEASRDRFDDRLVTKGSHDNAEQAQRQNEAVLTIKSRINKFLGKVMPPHCTAPAAPFNAIVLDGRGGNTSRALKTLASIAMSSILSPNRSEESAAALKELGVTAWAGWVEDVLRNSNTNPHLELSLIYLDHTGAFPPRQWQIRSSFKFLRPSSPHSVLAFTFSTRSGRWLNENDEACERPTETWGPPEAIYSLTSTISKACVETGWEVVDTARDSLEDFGMQKYELHPPHPHGLVKLANSLKEWAETTDRASVNIHKIGAAEAACTALSGRKVLGCLWTPTTQERAKEPFRPSHVNTDAGGISDNQIKRLINISREVGLDVTNTLGTPNPTFENVMLYPHQMMFVSVIVMKKKKQDDI